ncbi:hypothetical protein DF185_03510 [Marinifilum breve]|uniref:NodB homology domain-containing protein n=1 Tax=Marinifilum breve TaxID=2184082 RepID=A0A2V4A2M4_9BACT|nr:polysaccharide deacetylase family protein [Marinifilum breve]PXY03165.1 hypothetical protein DF185_03510 [Marinifilum breve]
MNKRLIISIGIFLLAALSVMSQTIEPLQSVKTKQKLLAFTFDDGPNPQTTAEIMNLFEKADGKATFFTIGRNLSKHTALAKEVLQRGHEIGNHSMTHKRPLETTTKDESMQEIKGFQEMIKKELGYLPSLYRAPFLKYDMLNSNNLESLGLKAVNASVYARDAKKDVPVEGIVKRIMEEVHSGAIVLCHERQHTIKALKQVLPQLKSEGYQFVTVSQLLSSGEENSIAANHSLIKIKGSKYHYIKNGVMVFPRHSASLLAMSKSKSKFSPVKAQTNTGVIVSFKTASPKVKVNFKVLEGDNRGPVFGIYQNKEFVKVAKFGKKDGPLLSFDIESAHKAKEVSYEISLPNWSNVGLVNIELEEGHHLKEIKSEEKPVYVAYGNSITHGTGQQASHQTYPFILSREMNWDLYNVAVGGGKTSVPMAEMIRDDFSHIDYMTILIGYNDYNGEGISAKAYSKRLENFLTNIREKHSHTKLFCITPTHTKTLRSKKSGESIAEFRKSMTQVVKEFQQNGDQNIFLIRGEEISKLEDLKDAVHFNVEGAKSFGEKLSIELKKRLATNN